MGTTEFCTDFLRNPRAQIFIQKRAAMGEDQKVYIASNDLVRRLQNNSEELRKALKVKNVDDYAQKTLGGSKMWLPGLHHL